MSVRHSTISNSVFAFPIKSSFFSVPFGIFKEYGIGTMGISCSFSYPTGMSAHASVLIT